METYKDILTLFPKHLFWDVDTKNLDVYMDRALIIPRALYMTTKNSFIQDISRLEELYTATLIVEELKKTKEKISNDVCKMVAERYSIPSFYRFK